jgi:hypothetical protein
MGAPTTARPKVTCRAVEARRRSADNPIDRAAALGAGLVRANLAGAAGLDREPELLLERAGDGAADRVMLPVRQETGWRPVASGDDPRGGRPRTSPAVTGEDKQDGEVT